MGFFAIIAAFWEPRVFLLLAWVFGFLDSANAWDTRFWPIIGWVLLPCTTATYGLCYFFSGGFGGSFGFLWVILMIIAFVRDIISWLLSAKKYDVLFTW